MLETQNKTPILSKKKQDGLIFSLFTEYQIKINGDYYYQIEVTEGGYTKRLSLTDHQRLQNWDGKEVPVSGDLLDTPHDC